jgi:hypothetical protein
VSVVPREELGRLLAGFEHTAYRLELLGAYEEASEAGALAAFTAGREPDIYGGKRGWMEKVDAAVCAGKTMRRVHVVTEPLSGYLRFEIGWSYRLNQAVGEDIRILPARLAPAVVMEAGDYWLLDSRTLLRMEYGSRGQLGAIIHVTDPGAIVAASHARDAALHHAISLDAYTEHAPQLQRAS